MNRVVVSNANKCSDIDVVTSAEDVMLSKCMRDEFQYNTCSLRARDADGKNLFAPGSILNTFQNTFKDQRSFSKDQIQFHHISGTELYRLHNRLVSREGGSLDSSADRICATFPKPSY